MKLSDIPSKFAIPFGASAGSGFIRTIPQASQIGIQAGAASLTDGFPPANFLPVGSGGTPPFGEDMNGILNQTTAWSRWQNAGGLVPFDATFSTAIGGYPKWALIASATTGQLWLSLVDDNTSNPDAAGAGWLAIPGFQTLTGNLTLYVRTDGNDSNNGLTNTAGGALRTIAAAYSKLKGAQTNGFSATIQLGIAGSYVGPFLDSGFFGNLFLTGDPANQDNYILTPVAVGANTHCVRSQVSSVTLNGLRLNGTGLSGDTCLFSGSGSLTTLQNVTVASSGAGTGFYGLQAISGGAIAIGGNLKIGGAFTAAVRANEFGIIRNNATSSPTITLSSTPSWTEGFASVVTGRATLNSLVFSGSAIGPRYLVSENGVIGTNGAGASYLPGSTVGSNPTGGQYV